MILPLVLHVLRCPQHHLTYCQWHSHAESFLYAVLNLDLIISLQREQHTLPPSHWAKRYQLETLTAWCWACSLSVTQLTSVQRPLFCSGGQRMSILTLLLWPHTGSDPVSRHTAVRNHGVNQCHYMLCVKTDLLEEQAVVSCFEMSSASFN